MSSLLGQLDVLSSRFSLILEILDVVYSHPDIIECAVVGVPNAKTGGAVKLFVVSTNPELTEQALIGFCREQLTGYKVPRLIQFADDLPKSPVSKNFEARIA